MRVSSAKLIGHADISCAMKIESNILLDQVFGIKTILSVIKLHVSPVFYALIFFMFHACSGASTQKPPEGLLNDELDYTLKLVQTPGADPVSYIDSVFSANPNAGVHDYIKKYSLISHYYSQHLWDWKLSLVYSDSLINYLKPIYKKYGLDYEYFDAILNTGSIFMAQSQSAAAFEYYMSVKSQIDNSNDPCMFSRFNGRMGSLSYVAYSFEESIEYYKHANKYASECDRFDEIEKNITYQGNYNNIATNFGRLEQPDSALYYYNKVEKLLNIYEEAIKDKPVVQFRPEEARGVLIGNMGTTYLYLGDSLTAEKYWLTSVEMNSRPGYALGHAQLIGIRLGNLYLEQNRLPEVLDIIEWVGTTLETLSENPAKQNWKELRYKYYEKIGSTEEAFLAFKDFFEEKIAYDEYRSSINLARELYLVEREHIIKTLKTDAQIKDFYLSASVLFILMAGFIIGLILVQHKKLKSYIDALEISSQKIKETNYELEKVNNDMTKIMKMVAHDLRNPLTGIIGMSGIMSENKTLSKSHKDMLNLINSAGKHADTLIHEIIELDLTQSFNETSKETIELTQFLRQCVALMQFKANEKNQVLELFTDKPVYIAINRDKVLRLISNLIGNAIKFSQTGSIIKINLTKTDKSVKILIEDHGIGIPNSIKSQIFDMFTPAKRQGTNGEKPFGLGLYISKSIAAAHGGSISVDSTPGSGSVFTIDLPVLENTPCQN